MHRFFLAPEMIGEETLTIIGDDYKHITKVLRLGPGDELEASDGAGHDYLCRIADLTDGAVTCGIVETYPSAAEKGGCRLTLFQGYAKGAKIDEIVKHSVEAGAARIIPFISRRTVAVPKDGTKKTLRLQRIAYEAAKQSKRGIVPMVEEPVTIKDLAKSLADYDLVVLAYEDEQTKSLKDVLVTAGDARSIAVIIGPEGGFTGEEAALLTEAGAHSVSLGKRILRTETAGVYTLAQLNFFFDN